MQDDKYPWLTMRMMANTTLLGCDRCGSSSTLKAPIPLATFSETLGTWSKTHSKCTERDLPETFSPIKPAKDPTARIAEWLRGWDVGKSSQYLATVFMGGRVADEWNFPLDPADFGRCYRLVQLAPEVKTIFGKVARVSLEWRRLIKNWNAIEKLYLEELPSGRAPKCYALMKECIEKDNPRFQREVRGDKEV